MNTLTTARRGLAVAFVVTFLLAAAVVVPSLASTSGEETASETGTVLRQVVSAEVENRPADDGAAAAGSSDVGALVDGLEADGTTETFNVYLRRDPFEPVVVQLSTDDGGDGATVDGTDSGGTDDGSGGTDGGAGSSGGNDDGNACSGSGNETVCEGTVITMTGFTDAGAALIEVDGALYEVETGDTFATSFRVERLDETAGCAYLRYGDEAFTICTGATVLK